MKLKSFFKRLILIEEQIDRVESPINGEITVYEDFFGRHSMRIGGVSQSGGLVIDIWKKAIKEVSKQKQCHARLDLASTCIDSSWSLSRLKHRGWNDIRCLILGLGCGGSANLVSKRWPEAEMVGIDLDPIVVEVGKKYFGLDKIPNLKIVVGDAFELVQSAKFKVQSSVKSSKFDVILVDLYLGQSFPKEAESEEFINGVKDILSEKGIVVFSRFYWGKYRVQAKDFEKKLRKYFPKVWTKKAISNLLIFCQQ